MGNTIVKSACRQWLAWPVMVASLGIFGSVGADADAGLDTVSSKCLECHGRYSGSRAVRVGGASSRHDAGSVNHPVGVAYDVAARYGGYRQRSEVDKRLLMPDGKLSCLSCHQEDNAEHGKLALSSERLCFECHDL